MTRPRARFLHAAGLRLDVPVEGSSVSTHGGQATSSAGSPLGRSVAERSATPLLEAAFTALDRLVDAALEREVDFLLLGGDTFCEADRSVPARAALRGALERLAERSIPVFVVPGTIDPATAWKAFPARPENVILLTPDPAGDGPHIIEREGADVVAVEYWHRQPITGPVEKRSRWRVAVLAEDPRSESASARGWRFNLEDAAADYLAVGPTAARRTETAGKIVLHAPGAVTACRRNETDDLSDANERNDTNGNGTNGNTDGPLHGAASLVTLDGDRGIRCEPVMLSPFRRACGTLLVDERTAEDTLVREMQRQLRTLGSPAGLETILVDWELRGRGPLIESLADPEVRQLLLDAAAEGLGKTGATLAQTIRSQRDSRRDSQRRFDELGGHAAGSPAAGSPAAKALRALAERHASRGTTSGARADADRAVAWASQYLQEWLT